MPLSSIDEFLINPHSHLPTHLDRLWWFRENKGFRLFYIRFRLLHEESIEDERLYIVNATVQRELEREAKLPLTPGSILISLVTNREGDAWAHSLKKRNTETKRCREQPSFLYNYLEEHIENGYLLMNIEKRKK